MLAVAVLAVAVLAVAVLAAVVLKAKLPPRSKFAVHRLARKFT